MKKYLVVVLLCSISLFAQQKTISVEYKAELFDDEKEVPNEFLKQMIQQALVDSKLIRFNLLIQDKSAKFYDLPSLSISNSNSKDFALAIMNFTGIKYIQNDTVFAEYDGIGKSKIIQKPLITDWKITSETKKIDDYTCYKATAFYKVINSIGEFNHPVTAWFCPSLPYSFGPNGYGGLPGLILELQVQRSWFGIDKIDFNSKTTFNMDEFTKKEKISEDELNKLLEKRAEERFRY